MRTYWDLTEVERAAMSRDDVAKFIDAELMLKGVLAVPPLTVADETPPALETTGYYRIGSQYEGLDIAFRSEADARAFLALGAMRITSEWSLGSDNRFVEPIKPGSIQLIPLPSKAAVQASAGALKEAEATKSENERRRRDHAEATKKVDGVLKDLWDDWHACVAKAQRMARIAETFTKYVGIAGDKDVAARFLAQTFAPSEIAEAIEWTGVDMVAAPVVGGAEA